MDKIQKCDDSFSQSLSSSSRRVMWKLSGEEETFDSLVNCRRLPVPGLCVTVQQANTNSNSDHDQEFSTSAGVKPRPKRSANENWLKLMKEMRRKKASNDNPKNSTANTSTTSLQEVPQATNSYWHHLFGKISQKELGNRQIRREAAVEETTGHALNVKPSLGLRYRPSHESLKVRQSKDHQPSVSSKPRLVMTDLKMESCGLPPQQTCVVREVAPKFAQRMRMSLAESDSCCSGDLEGPKNSPVAKLSNASSSASNTHTAQQLQGERPRSEVISVHVSTPTSSAFVTNNKRSPNAAITKRRLNTNKVTAAPIASSALSTTTTAAAPLPPPQSAAATANKSSASTSSNGIAFPTFRQRQQELHRYRVQIEQRRLDLLELKIAREREDAIHNEILFHKELQIKENQIKAYEDNDCSNA